jgi:hypothetical protein
MLGAMDAEDEEQILGGEGEDFSVSKEKRPLPVPKTSYIERARKIPVNDFPLQLHMDPALAERKENFILRSLIDNRPFIDLKWQPITLGYKKISGFQNILFVN